jgi:lipid A ethanolaminephosphotransferase
LFEGHKFSQITLYSASFIVVTALLSFWLLFKKPISFSSYGREVVQKAFVAVFTLALIAGLYMSSQKESSAAHPI